MIKRQISFLFEDPGFCIDVFCTIAEPVRYYNRDTESGAWYSSTPDWNENGSLIREDLIFEVIADGVVCALDGNGNFEGKKPFVPFCQFRQSLVQSVHTQYPHLQNQEALGLYFGGVFLIGVILLYGLIKIFRNWYSNDAIQGSKSQPVDWNKQTTEQHSPVSALLERERTRYFSLPVYLTNTACGLLFAAVFVLLVVLMSDKITPYIYQLAEYFQVPFADYDVLFIYAFSILTTISCTTYVSISIEGKQIEILKSLPIAAKCLFRVKLLHHLSMSVPTIFVLNTIMALYLQWSFPKAMLGYAFPLLCSVLIGMIGYILNLIFPNFEWENVTHIIKQSLPAILTALIGVVVTCGTAYLLLRFFPSALFMGSWLACAIILLLLLTMVAWVDKKGQHLYQEL